MLDSASVFPVTPKTNFASSIQVCISLTDHQWVVYSCGVPSASLCPSSYHPMLAHLCAACHVSNSVLRFCKLGTKLTGLLLVMAVLYYRVCGYPGHVGTGEQAWDFCPTALSVPFPSSYHASCTGRLFGAFLMPSSWSLRLLLGGKMFFSEHVLSTDVLH